MNAIYKISVFSVMAAILVFAGDGRAQSQTTEAIGENFGPVIPQPNTKYRLSMEERVSTPQLNGKLLKQESANIFDIVVSKVDEEKSGGNRICTGLIRWKERRTSTAFNEAKSAPDVSKWDDEAHRSSFSVTLTSQGKIKAAEVKKPMAELKAGVAVFLSCAVFPTLPIEANGSITLPNPLYRPQNGTLSGPPLALTSPGENVWQCKPTRGNNQTDMLLKLMKANEVLSVQQLHASQDRDWGGHTQVQRELKLSREMPK